MKRRHLPSGNRSGLRNAKRQDRPAAPACLQGVRKTAELFALQEKLEDAIFFGLSNQLIAGLLGKSRKVLQRPRIGGLDSQNLPRLHLGQSLLGPQNGQRAIQSLNIKIAIKFHGR